MALELANLYCAMPTCRQTVTYVSIQRNQSAMLFRSGAGLVCARHAEELDSLNGLSMPLEVYAEAAHRETTVKR